MLHRRQKKASCEFHFYIGSLIVGLLCLSAEDERKEEIVNHGIKKGRIKKTRLRVSCVGDYKQIKGCSIKKEEGANYWEPAVRERPAGIYFPMILVFIPTKTRFFLVTPAWIESSRV